MEVVGYKCFALDADGNLINRYGSTFCVGNDYHADGDIKFGNYGNGFHMCQNFEDTFRYFDCCEEMYGVPYGIILCKVVGSGDIDCYEDDYYGFYNMYAVSDLRILSIVSKKELIQMADNLNDERLKRFINLFGLVPQKYNYFLSKYEGNNLVTKHIKYYKNVYAKRKRISNN